jgi:hypothetical protein
LKKLLRNRSGTAEIVGTVLFLVILFFFFSNVFLWHNQVAREMDQVVADKTNSAVRMETTAVPGPHVAGDEQPGMVGLRDYQGLHEVLLNGRFSLIVNYTFHTTMDMSEKKTLIADLRLSVHASFTKENSTEPCFVQVLDCNQNAWVDTGLMVTNGYRWSNATLFTPNNYIDGEGNVTIRILDASTELGYNDTQSSGILNVDYAEVCADSVALEVSDLGGSDTILSRIWIVTATQTQGVQANHVFADLNGTAPNDILVAGGSTRTIMLSNETQLTPEGSISVTDNAGILTVKYAPPAGQTVMFRVLTTLGNTAACSYSFP